MSSLTEKGIYHRKGSPISELYKLEETLYNPQIAALGRCVYKKGNKNCFLVLYELRSGIILQSLAVPVQNVLPNIHLCPLI